MLIEVPYKIGDTVSLKLSSGEEIVARLKEEDATKFVLNKPMVLIAQAEGLGLAPYMFSVSPDAKFSILATSVSCIAKTQDEIASEASSVRYERDELLTQCDWTQMPDSPLDSTIKASWATYRTELRDVTEQSGFPTDITWPTTP